MVGSISQKKDARDANARMTITIDQVFQVRSVYPCSFSDRPERAAGQSQYFASSFFVRNMVRNINIERRLSGRTVNTI